MSYAVLDSISTAPAAVFSVVDAFARFRGIAGPGAGLAPIGRVQFRVVATGGPAARQPVEPPWDLPLVESSPGLLLSYGRVTDVPNRRLQAVGPPIAVELEVSGAFYRELTLSAHIVGGKVVPRLINLDPSAPIEVPDPVTVELHPGPTYPFPNPVGFALVRGSVKTATNQPISGATVTASTSTWADSFRTGRSGQWVFVVPDNAVGLMTVVASVPSNPSQQLPVREVKPSAYSSFPPFVFP